eukprot:gene18013-23651_t
MPKNGIVSTSNQLFMIDISPVVTVATSKAKPKTITVLSLNKSIKFLVKQERNGDLRKDARMMEFNNVVNRIFVSSYEESFQDPTEWYETRVIFIRSLAVWSIVGYIIGLGLTLLKPEIVPFRLTSNLIDVMGFSGIEEPFLRDPTVAWSRSGRAQQLSQTSNNLKSKIEFQDLENKDAKDTLLKILGRLNGMYNIVHPYSLNIQKAYKQRKETLPSKGLGALPDEIFPLSIPGQIQRLIEEATCEENLSQMYVGWQPWA